MSFRNENEAAIPPLPRNSKFQIGRSDEDNTSINEEGAVGQIPWSSEPEATWVYFDCTVGVMLDSGIVVHNRLPQVNNAYDTLFGSALDAEGYDKMTGIGVNLRCNDQYADIVQRMGHSRYWFRIWGQALRIGYQVPIPGIKKIGGVPAIPYDKNPQWAFNRIFPGGNYSGVILWHAMWSLWYTTAQQTIDQTIPAVDPLAHITGTVATVPPRTMQAPFTYPDPDAETRPVLPTAINVPTR